MDPGKSESPQEPLQESAPLAHAFATDGCGTDPLSGSSCAWYHGTWQYLRMLGIGAAPGAQGMCKRRAFLQRLLR